MSITTTTQEFSNNNDGFSQQSVKQTKVYVRLMFVRIGEIDTLNEKFQAQVTLEARWAVDVDQLSSALSSDDDKQKLNNGESVQLEDYAESNWHPQLFVENSLNARKDIKYSAKQSKRDNRIYVCEHRELKGSFWEKLELNNFPTDVQDLSITVVSELYDNKVVLLPDPYRLSAVNSQAFLDQQEWRLYKHIDVDERLKPDLLFLTGDQQEDDDDLYENTRSGEIPKRSAFTVTCHAARQSSYFFWNGFALIFLITSISLCAFAVPPTLPANRLAIVSTLLLTEIAFRFTLNRSLPTVSYLTLIDAYGIACIFYLVVQCIWFSIIGGLMLVGTEDAGKTQTVSYAHEDYEAFIVFVIIFILINLGFILWLFFGPYRIRRNMAKKEEDYKMLMFNQGRSQPSKSGTDFSKQSVPYSRIP